MNAKQLIVLILASAYLSLYYTFQDTVAPILDYRRRFGADFKEPVILLEKLYPIMWPVMSKFLIPFLIISVILLFVFKTKKPKI